MAKRMQEQNEEERIVAKSKSTAINLSSHVPTKSLIREKSDCVEKSRDTHSYGENPKAGREEIQNPTQRRVLKRDCKMHTLAGSMDTATGKPVATKEESRSVDPSESETGSEEDVTGKPVAQKKKTATRQPHASSKIRL